MYFISKKKQTEANICLKIKLYKWMLYLPAQNVYASFVTFKKCLVYTAAVLLICSWENVRSRKKMFLKISENSQERVCVGVSF